MASATTEANKVANTNTTKLIKVADEITKIVDALKHTTGIHEDLTQDIAEKEQALNQLDTKFQEESRRRQVELELDFKEREASKVDQILKAQGKQAVNAGEYTVLVDSFTALKTEFSKRLEEEAGKIRGMESAKTASAIKQAQLELQVKEAANTAAITSLTEKNTLLAEQVKDYKGQLDAEREARVQEARARGTAMVTVNGTK